MFLFICQSINDMVVTNAEEAERNIRKAGCDLAYIRVRRRSRRGTGRLLVHSKQFLEARECGLCNVDLGEIGQNLQAKRVSTSNETSNKMCCY